MASSKLLWRWGILGAVIIAASLAFVACGDDEEAPATSAAPGQGETIEIRMADFEFIPNTIRIKEGQPVTIQLPNAGKVDHEFMIGRDVERHDNKPEGYAHNFFEGMKPQFTGKDAKMMEEEAHGLEVEVEPGGTGTLTFTVPAGKKGEWEIGCFEPGHYEAGMKGKFIVE